PFSHSPGPPTALHPFPTRRSSDLEHDVAGRGNRARSGRRGGCGAWGAAVARRTVILRGVHDGCAVGNPREVARRAGERQAQEPRSEEHTSELQSLTNLVCRLLLEK